MKDQVVENAWKCKEGEINWNSKKGRLEYREALVKEFSLDGFVMWRSGDCLINNMGQDGIT